MNPGRRAPRNGLKGGIYTARKNTYHLHGTANIDRVSQPSLCLSSKHRILWILLLILASLVDMRRR